MSNIKKPTCCRELGQEEIEYSCGGKLSKGEVFIIAGAATVALLAIGAGVLVNAGLKANPVPYEEGQLLGKFSETEISDMYKFRDAMFKKGYNTYCLKDNGVLNLYFTNLEMVR